MFQRIGSVEEKGIVIVASSGEEGRKEPPPLPMLPKEPTSEKKRVKNFMMNVVAGGSAGVIAKTVTAPIERVKLLLQTQEANVHISKDAKYKGALDAFVRIPREQGFTSFWRGNTVNVYRYFPTQALNFAFKDRYKEMFVKHDSKEDPGMYVLESLLAGGMAGSTALLFVYPLDLARTRMAADVGDAQHRQFRSITHCWSQIYRVGGVTGLYKGFQASLLGIFVYRALWMGGYDVANNYILTKDSHLWEKWAVAQSTTMIAALACYPIDSIRRRMMMQGGEKEVLYNSTLDCVRKVAQTEGLRGFYKGALVNMVRGLGGPIILLGYDKIMEVMNEKWE